MSDVPRGAAVCIVGMGAIGGYVGGCLIRAGVDVTFVDQWQEHVDTVRADGLLVQCAETGDFVSPTLAPRSLTPIDFSDRR